MIKAKKKKGKGGRKSYRQSFRSGNSTPERNSLDSKDILTALKTNFKEEAKTKEK